MAEGAEKHHWQSCLKILAEILLGSCEMMREQVDTVDCSWEFKPQPLDCDRNIAMSTESGAPVKSQYI